MSNGNSSALWKEVRLSSNSVYDGPIQIEEYTSFLHGIASGNYSYNESLSINAIKRLNVLCLMNGEIERDVLDNLVRSFPEPLLYPKFGKATGTDGWSGELLHLIAPILTRIVPFLFAVCLKSGITPSIWDDDIKIPIPKPGKPPNKPNSLRPITLVNVLMKQYEEWIICILDQFCYPSENQAGFKVNYSCSGRLFALRGLLDIELGRTSSIFAIFVDFASFFDTIREELLCDYLLDRKVPEFLVRAIHGMLSNVQASVFMKGKMGIPFKCKVGLRQGSKSSPRLATLFLDQLTDVLKNCKGGIQIFDLEINHIFYADDLVLLFTNWEQAQHALNTLSLLCSNLGLVVSIEKSFSVHFRKAKKKGVKQLSWGTSPLVSLDSAKYLGCTIDSKVRFGEHFHGAKQKSNRAFSVLMNFQKRFTTLKFSEFLKLYNTLVYPTFAYASEVFVWSDGEKYEDIFTEHLRRYFGLPKSVSKKALLYMSGTLPVQAKMALTAYKFWARIMSLDEHRYEKMIFRSMKCNRDKKNWYSEMIDFFAKIGFSGDFEYWNHLFIRNNLTRFEKCISRYYRQQLHNWATNSSYRFLI